MQTIELIFEACSTIWRNILETLALSLLMIAAGIYFGIRNVRLLTNEGALREYVQKSPKAVKWVNQYGVDGAMKMSRQSFLPLGIIMSIAMMGFGLWNLWRIYG